MRLIDADKFLGYLIYSKHIDSLLCIEVKDAVEMCKVDVLERIMDEVNKLKKVSDGNKVYVGINDVFDIIDKYMKEQTE